MFSNGGEQMVALLHSEQDAELAQVLDVKVFLTTFLQVIVKKFVEMEDIMETSCGDMLMQMNVMMLAKDQEMDAALIAGQRKAGNAEVELLQSMMFAGLCVLTGEIFTTNSVMMETK